jgi:hypothetical protein
MSTQQMAYKLLTEERLWQELLHNKYIKDKTLSQVQGKPTDSPFWKGLMRVKNEFFNRGSFKVGDGTSVRFLEDIWLGDSSLANQYPSLYNIVQRKNVFVANVLAHSQALPGNKWNEWLHLCQSLSNQPDRFVWKFTKTGAFTITSMLMNEDAQFLQKYLWKLKLPLKIKIFMWFLRGKVLLTKDKLIKPKCKGCRKCCFCESPGKVQHLLISCPFIQIIRCIIYFIYNIPPPSNITNMFGNWLNGVPKEVKDRIRIGVSALCWSIWTCRSNIIFNNQKDTKILQVL